jgi:(p)ppGpp synthase/HD superfamily hydrolase
MQPRLLLKRALDHAALWHKNQKRKYPGVEIPYVSHVAGVAAILSRHGFDDEVVAAGALHDVIEDAGVTHAELARLFGSKVADLVQSSSEEDKSQPWEERKRRYLDAFLGKPWEAQAITLADKVDNFLSILVCVRDYGDPWPMFRRGRDAQLAQFDALAAKLSTLASHPLLDEYRAALEEVRKI